LRQRMFESARTLVSAVGYTNAGTLEFLLDAEGNYYFLEVNTRLQVEHPVTEMCTGLDLVELQLRVARGERLPLSTEEIVRRGAAIECRISAEDVYAGFMPSIGVVREVIEPEGENIRVDSALYDGMPVTLYYDPMLAKVITWGETRDAAIATMLEALDRLHIAGISTTAPFCRFVLNHPSFRDGNYSTGFVGEHWNGVEHALDPEILQLAAAAAIRTSERLEERMMAATVPERIAL
jgi:acetyl-CoA carboxylase, biotin carboxylase subunit